MKPRIIEIGKCKASGGKLEIKRSELPLEMQNGFLNASVGGREINLVDIEYKDATSETSDRWIYVGGDTTLTVLVNE